MKAYRVFDVNGEGAIIVFAENATKAKSVASIGDYLFDTKWTDLRVLREPDADCLYDGKPELDWYDPETRKSLVRDMGWACLEPSWECDTCQAKEFCRHLQE